jgi:hypothetical protein
LAQRREERRGCVRERRGWKEERLGEEVTDWKIGEVAPPLKW